MEPEHSPLAWLAILTDSDPHPSEVARDALTAIARYRLPATPSVYEVWYRYFAGGHPGLGQAIDERIGPDKSNVAAIDLDWVRSLHREHCNPVPIEGRLTDALASELAAFESIVGDQQEAGDSYATSLETIRVAAGSVTDTVGVTKLANSLEDETVAMRERLRRMNERIQAAESRVGELQRDLRSAQSILMTDHLTGIGNRRFFDAVLRASIGKVVDAEGRGVPHLAFLDCDKLKGINDRFGHAAGDAAIRSVARVMRRIRPAASIARLGGDEFALFDRFHEQLDVEACADELREAVAGESVADPTTGEPLPRLTFSVGVARLRASDDVASWPERADRLMYEAKRLGGNRCVVERKLG